MERAHVLEDGGGRELAYVKMSRARERSTVYVVADSVEQAAEDLSRSWAQSRRIGWAIDQGHAGARLEAEAERDAGRVGQPAPRPPGGRARGAGGGHPLRPGSADRGVAGGHVRAPGAEAQGPGRGRRLGRVAKARRWARRPSPGNER